MGFGAATTDNLTAPASSHLDTLTKVTLIVLARTRAFTTTRNLVEKAVTSVGGFHMRLATTNGIQLRWWRTTNTTYGYDNTVALNRWQWFVAVGDANAGAGLKWRLFTAPIDRLVREAARTATTEGSGALASSSANALTIGNAKTATTLAYQGDIALVAVFGDQLALSAIHGFQADPHPGVHGGFPCLGFWRPGHRGQTGVMDETFRAGAAVNSGGVAVSGGVQFWNLPLVLGKSGGINLCQASGTGVASGSATLNVTERLQASGTGTASGSATLNVTERLQASGTGVATGSAVLNVTERLQATGSGVATGSATLTITERLQATGSGVATGSATLNVTERLQATGSGVATGSATLTITAGSSHNLRATGTGAATGTALLNVTKRLLATGTGGATGSAVLRAERRLQAIGGATAGGSAALTRIIALSASGAGVGAGIAGLYVERRLQATGNATADGTGRLYSDTPVSAQTSRYELQRTLSLGALTGLRSGFERERNLALDSIKRG